MGEARDQQSCRAAAMEHSDLVRVKKVKGKGRGVFARRDIARGTVIERAPVALLPMKYLVDGKNCPVLAKYFYAWNRSTVAIALGFGSPYNHSYAPNAIYSDRNLTIIYRALRNIAAGDEITVNYNGKPNDNRPMDFDVV
jgi:SET domain-containing protein